MIYFDGVVLRADEYDELHQFARKIGVSKSWCSLHPIPYYNIICSFKRRMILDYIKRRNKIKENGKV